MQTQMFKKVSETGAEFSEDRKFRFALWRIWDESKPLVMFIGLNPSTANETTPDATIRSVIRISKSNGYGGFYMMNCWPFVATQPKYLQIDAQSDQHNDFRLKNVSELCKDVVLAWGTFKIVKERGRDKELLKMFPSAKVLGINEDGSPKHPLFQKGTTVLTYYNHIKPNQ